MPCRIWTPLLLFVLLVANAGFSALAAEEIPQPPVGRRSAVEGLLVLRNGSILRGAVHRLANYYHVKLEKGSLQISADQVEMFCHSLEEAYARRRELRTAGSADSHLALMRWCLRHQLLEQAARELLDARVIDPGHPSLPMLQRQLQQILRNSSFSHQPSAENAPQDSVVQVSNNRLLPQTSARVRAEFVRKIQPILVQSCTAAGCHGSDALPSETIHDFRLSRSALGGAGHPEVTKRNLASTLAQCKGEGPKESALLQKARTSHAGSQPLSARQLELLTAWLAELNMEDGSKAEPDTEDERKAEPEQLSHIATDVPSEGVQQAGGWPGAGRPFRPDTVRLWGNSSKTRHGVKLRAEGPRDPFDAEVFNRHVESSAE